MDDNKLVGGLEEFLNQADFVLDYDGGQKPPISSLYAKPPVRE